MPQFMASPVAKVSQHQQRLLHGYRRFVEINAQCCLQSTGDAAACHRSQVISAAGLVAALSGEALRKAAMLTAQHSFTHAVAFEKRRQHQLITSGVSVGAW